MELVDMLDSKSGDFTVVWVRVPSLVNECTFLRELVQKIRGFLMSSFIFLMVLFLKDLEYIHVWML